MWPTFTTTISPINIQHSHLIQEISPLSGTHWDCSLSLSSPECWHAEQSVKIGTMAPPIQHNTARYVSKHSLHLSQLSTLHTRDYLRCCLLLTLFDIEISSSGWFSSRADSYRIWVITEEHNCDHWSVDSWPAGHQTNSEREREREPFSWYVFSVSCTSSSLVM